MGYHARAQAFAPNGEQSEQRPKARDSQAGCDALITVRNPEKYRLQNQRTPPSACECLKLLLEITTEDKLLAESGADRDANPKQDFQRSLWQISLDGSGGADPDPVIPCRLD